MTPRSASTALRLTTLAVATATLAGCSMLDGLRDHKVDYRNGARKTAPLDIPPDLTPLARDGRYAPQSGSVSANELQQRGSARAPAAGPAAETAAAVAPSRVADIRLERDGQVRWLRIDRPAQTVWPQVRQFWLDQGFELAVDNAGAGVLETEWAENRAKLPQDLIRRTLGKVMDRIFDTSERDRYRIRVERTADGRGTDVYVAHHGLALQVERSESSTPFWVSRPSDPSLEAEMLSRIMLALGGPAEAAAQAAQTAAAGAAATAAPVAARPLAQPSTDGTAGLSLDEPLERAWRRVGLALDRGGFTVEERDRAQGLYLVRYVDPKLAAKEKGFFARIFSSDSDKDQSLQRYRLTVRAAGDQRTTVTVLDAQGQPDRTENGKRIATVLAEELK